MLRRDVVRRDDDGPAAPAGSDPVVRETDGLSARGASLVGGDVRPPCTDVLGELGVPEGQHLEEEASVESSVADEDVVNWNGAVFSLANVWRLTERKVEVTCVDCNKCIEICPCGYLEPRDA